MTTILIVLYKRPDYTKQVLDALSKQVTNERVIIRIDGYNKDVITLAKDFKRADEVVINGSVLGCNKNIMGGIDIAFRESENLIVVEDDCVPGYDFLKYMKWGFTHLNDSIRTISGYHKPSNPVDHNKYSSAFLSNDWNCYGWGLKKDTWDIIKSEYEPSGASWDWDINHKTLMRFKVIKPFLSRVKNIGALNGTYCEGPEWHRREVELQRWVDTEEISQEDDFRLDN